MPVIAKLSRRFYEVLGEDVADQMVDWFNQVGEAYRTDWRRYYDASISRSDVRFEPRLAQLELDINLRITRLEAKVTDALRELRYETARGHQALEASLEAVKRTLAANRDRLDSV